MRVGDPVAEDGRPVHLCAATQPGTQAGAVKDIVAQDQRGVLVPDEVGADGEGLRQPLRLGLHRILQVDAKGAAITQQPVELLAVVRGGDDQHVPDTGQHQRRQWVEDHRLVIDGQQLLAGGHRDRVQATTRTAGQDYAAHDIAPSGCRLAGR